MKNFIYDAIFHCMKRKIYYSFHEIPWQGYYVKPKIRFSKEEIGHLLISILVLSFAFSIARSSENYLYFYRFFPISFLAIVTAFACHEIAHKYMGMKYGYPSEYRMFPQGLLFALLFSFFGFVFAAPGAVHIFGMPSREEGGKIAASGPITNIMLAATFLTISNFAIRDIAISLALINSFLAFFNLLPLPPLDGRKIFAWDIRIWIAMLVISLAMLILTF